MFSKCFDEVLGGDILHGVSVLVDEGEVLLKALVKTDTPIRDTYFHCYFDYDFY